jgi:ribose-phosphate pyrophosphokinase
VATHGLLVGDALARLAQNGVRQLIVTDSVAPPSATAALPVRVVTIAPLMAEAIRRLHEDGSLADLLVHC